MFIQVIEIIQKQFSLIERNLKRNKKNHALVNSKSLSSAPTLVVLAKLERKWVTVTNALAYCTWHKSHPQNVA
jgi:hypothetical protein